MNFSYKIEPSGQWCRASFDIPEGQVARLTARNVEELISALAELRSKMIPEPSVFESPLLLPPAERPIDAISPQVDVAPSGSPTHPLHIGIAFPGLGWRVVALSPESAAKLSEILSEPPHS
jgi:hypothetical protein